jgi:hypothetical protein
MKTTLSPRGGSLGAATLLALMIASCEEVDQRPKLDAIERRIHRLEAMFPEDVSYSSEPVEEIISEAPEYTAGTRPPYPPEGLPRYFNDRNEWETAAMQAVGNLVVPRTGMAAVVADDRIVVLGGHGPGLTQAIFRGDIEMIDYGVHVERIRAGLLRRRYQSAETYQGKIYIMAGMTTAEGNWDWRKVFPDDLEIYDLATGNISKGAPIPSARYLAASEILDGKIYVVGGTPPRREPQRESDGKSYLSNANTQPDKRLFIYDIAANRWTEGAPMGVARQCELVAYKGKLYAVAGYSGRTAVTAFEEYDPAVNRWTRLPDLPFTLSAQKCVVVGDLLFSFGDYAEMTQICVYDFAAKKWGKLAIRMKPSRQGVAALIKDRIFVAGGNAGGGRAIGDGGAGPEPLATIQTFTVRDLTRAARAALR